jgi:hypothetical protein
MLPPFPTDDQTLDLLDAALRGLPVVGGRSSVGELCDMYSELAEPDDGAVDLGVDPADGGVVRVMRDEKYHPNDIIAALMAEVRRLRTAGR